MLLSQLTTKYPLSCCSPCAASYKPLFNLLFKDPFADASQLAGRFPSECSWQLQYTVERAPWPSWVLGCSLSGCLPPTPGPGTQGLLFGSSPPAEPGSVELSILSPGVQLSCKMCLVEQLGSPTCCWDCFTLPGNFFSFTMNKKVKSNRPPCAPARGRHLQRQNGVYPVTCIWLESNKGMLTHFCFCKTKYMQQ